MKGLNQNQPLARLSLSFLVLHFGAACAVRSASSLYREARRTAFWQSIARLQDASNAAVTTVPPRLSWARGPRSGVLPSLDV